MSHRKGYPTSNLHALSFKDLYTDTVSEMFFRNSIIYFDNLGHGILLKDPTYRSRFVHSGRWKLLIGTGNVGIIHSLALMFEANSIFFCQFLVSCNYFFEWKHQPNVENQAKQDHDL